MKKLLTALLLTLAGVVIIGCKDNSVTGPLGTALDKAKGVITGEHLPETDVNAAIANHGFHKLLTWAEDGDMKAQHFVAVAYLLGDGVPQSYSAAEKWALRAANQGAPASQYLIGSIRMDAISGARLRDVDPNAVRAYMWFCLAAAQGNEPARNARDKFKQIIGPELVERAQALAAAWHPCHEQACIDIEPGDSPALLK